MTKHRIYVADDHPIVLQGLTLILAAHDDLEVVGTSAKGTQALDDIRRLKPDLAILDLQFCDSSGLMIARQLSAEFKALRLLALTQSEAPAMLREALASGFHGYIVKRSAPRHLIDAIHGVMVGGLYIDALVAAQLYSTPRKTAALLPAAELTSRESDVLRAVAKGGTAKAIAQTYGISISSVETYKSRACTKLGLSTRADIVRFASSRGWLDGTNGKP